MVEKPAPRVTGDSELDRALADVEAGWPAWQNGAGKLAGMQPNAHRAVVAQKLAAQADAADRNKRHAMLRALVVWATPNEVPVLIKALDDENVFARHDVLGAIGKFRDERTLAPVVRCFQEDPTRGPAAQALRDMGAMAEMEVLALLDIRDTGPLRRDVVNVLKDVGTQQSVPALQAVATGKDAIVARSAREALNAIAARTR
jgi:HEAT repeat protein